MNDKTKAIAALGTVGAIVMASAVEYVSVTRSERKKRKQIKAWETMNLACIENSRTRLMQIAQTGDLTELGQAMAEETAFLAIVRHEPMYED